jgi:HEPN domain-containing protein
LNSKIKFNPIVIERMIKQLKQYARASKKNNNFAKKWLDIAKDDIEISELLKNSKHYASSVYHLQQAFEKLSKCYFILSGRMEPDQAKEHKFVLNRLRIEIKETYINNFLELSKSITDNSIIDNSIDVASGEKVLDFIGSNEEEIRKISSSDIEAMFNLFNRIENKLLDPYFIKATEKKLKQRKLLKGLKHLIFRITHFRASYSDVDELTDIKQVRNYFVSCVISIKLQFLSLITYVHANNPRYPFIKDSVITYFNYNDSLGIVKKIDSLIDNFNIIAKSIESIYLLNNN